MPVTDFNIDDAWRTRIPQGWMQFADGSVGPPNGPSGSDWNAPYRQGAVSPGASIPDWLKQLIPSPGASVPNAPGSAPAAGLSADGSMPGGGVMAYQGATPGQPSMGFPAQGGGPQPQAGAPGGGSSWLRPQPINPAAVGGGFNPLAMLGNINPYARAAIAAGGVMQPTPTAANDQAPTNNWMQRPSGVGGMPGPQVTNPGQPYRPYSPTPQNYPSWPTVGPGGSSGVADQPTGSPSDTPRPGSSASYPLPPRRPKNLGGQGQAAAAPASAATNPLFGTMQSQVPGGGRGPLGNNPVYTTLNLPELFKRMRS